MGRIEELATRYRGHIAAQWQRNLAGDQKAIFVVYPKTDERKLRARLELFEMATTSAAHGKVALLVTDDGLIGTVVSVVILDAAGRVVCKETTTVGGDE